MLFSKGCAVGELEGFFKEGCDVDSSSTGAILLAPSIHQVRKNRSAPAALEIHVGKLPLADPLDLLNSHSTAALCWAREQIRKTNSGWPSGSIGRIRRQARTFAKNRQQCDVFCWWLKLHKPRHGVLCRKPWQSWYTSKTPRGTHVRFSGAMRMFLRELSSFNRKQGTF